MMPHTRTVVAPPSPGLDMALHYGYAQSTAIRAAGFIFCSGMVAVDPRTGERMHGTVGSETRQIFENLSSILSSAGSSLDRVVQIHALIYDRREYDNLNRVYRSYVPMGPPARTVWSVDIGFGLKVQIDATAVA
jgi:2-iminobutanoate/2-iminopropanoate deaminase